MGGGEEAKTDKTSSDAWGRKKCGWKRVCTQERWLGSEAGSLEGGGKAPG